MEVSLATREDESSHPPGYFHHYYGLPPAPEAFDTHRHRAHHERLHAYPELHSDEQRESLFSSDVARHLSVGSRHLLGSLQNYDYCESLSHKRNGTLGYGKCSQMDSESCCVSTGNHSYNLPSFPSSLTRVCQTDKHNSVDTKCSFNRQTTTNSYIAHSTTHNHRLTDSIHTIRNNCPLDSQHRVSSQYAVGAQTCMNLFIPSSTCNSYPVRPNSNTISEHTALALQHSLTSSHNLLLSHNPTPSDSPVLSKFHYSSSNIQDHSPYPSWAGQKPEAEDMIGRPLISGRPKRNGTEPYTSYHTMRASSTCGEQLKADSQGAPVKQVCTPYQLLDPLPSTSEKEEQLRVPYQCIGEDPMCKPAKLAKDGQFRLQYQDFMEIKKLKESYHVRFDSTLPLKDRMIKTDEMSKLYSLFVQKRAKFFVSSPLYKTLAVNDRPKLLHIAVAMSTYFTGAHLIDTRDYVWRERLGMMEETASPIMSASTLRHFLTHEQFVYLMRFYTTYSTVFSDQTIAILMQMLSLFYPQPGLKEPEMVKHGRLHYGSLLSRYLLATHGPEEGPERLKMLIVSEQEARYLVDLLQHVELTPGVPRQDLVNSKRLLLEGLQIVCQEARENMARRKKERCETESSGFSEGSHPRSGLSDTEEPHTVPRSSSPSSPSPSSLPVQNSERVDFIAKSLTHLANCNDPMILAEARKILPTDLIRRIFQPLL